MCLSWKSNTELPNKVYPKRSRCRTCRLRPFYFPCLDYFWYRTLKRILVQFFVCSLVCWQSGQCRQIVELVHRSGKSQSQRSRHVTPIMCPMFLESCLGRESFSGESPSIMIMNHLLIVNAPYGQGERRFTPIVTSIEVSINFLIHFLSHPRRLNPRYSSTKRCCCRGLT